MAIFIKYVMFICNWLRDCTGNLWSGIALCPMAWNEKEK
jgi:hypothetical protein